MKRKHIKIMKKYLHDKPTIGRKKFQKIMEDYFPIINDEMSYVICNEFDKFANDEAKVDYNTVINTIVYCEKILKDENK